MTEIRGTVGSYPATRAALFDVVRFFVESDLSVLGRRSRVQWMIDTGSPYTILTPDHTERILGDALFDLNFDEDPRQFAIGGMIGGRGRTIITPAQLTFTNIDGETHPIRLPILIAEPTPPRRADSGNWRMPSLLGCDALRYFDLSLSLNPPSVTLTEAPPA